MGQIWLPPFFPLLLFQFQLPLPKLQTSSVSMGMEEGCLSFSVPNICLYKQLRTQHLFLLGLGCEEEVLCLSGGGRLPRSSRVGCRLDSGSPGLVGRQPVLAAPWGQCLVAALHGLLVDLGLALLAGLL